MKTRHFGTISERFDMQDLLEIQVQPFEEFLQRDVPRTRRKNTGLQEVFNEVFPIESPDGSHHLEFLHYTIGKPKYDLPEAQRRGLTYAAPLSVKLRLRGPKGMKEQEVYLGDIPLMTRTGTFIINGDERVVVSQLHRSPGAFFEEGVHPNGKRMYTARVIPYRGAWLEFEFDLSDVLHAVIDRKRKVLVTTFLRAIGAGTDEEILEAFCGVETIKAHEFSDVKAAAGRILAVDLIDPQTQGVLLSRFQTLEKEQLNMVWNSEIREIKVLKNRVPEILKTFEKDRLRNVDDSVMDLFRKLRPGDPATLASAQNLLHRLYFDPKRYDLGRVGRYIINRKLGLEGKLEDRVVDPKTILAVLKYLLQLKGGQGEVDDIDHLGSRRVRSVGELLQNQFRIAFARVERSVRERMGIFDLSATLPHQLVNAKLVSGLVRDFFGRSQLSQFLDQTNPLAELTHKRRLSALGPGGLSRKRAGFEVRDVHHSHYGRICPIETPEGPNIGLIASLSTYACINEFGFIETPYWSVDKGRVVEKPQFLAADTEDKYVIAQANARLSDQGRFLDKLVRCRHRGDFPLMNPNDIHFKDVSPKQLVSVAASLIPFLEHDDANRALMGSNMQRQAVPLLFPEAPFIGTGMEGRAAKDSGAVVTAQAAGIVREVQADRIVVDRTVYDLKKFRRSNANTSINQRPLVQVGQKVKAGDVLADGSATQDGLLALGRNLLVAFMPWRGYNFEDAILVSERLVKEDIFTSIHIEEFEIEARDTRLGNEEITRDIPNVGEEALKDLDEQGIVRLGAEVRPGDILVGKVIPKSETEQSPEERLLRAIFGEKAGDVRDASLTVPPGVEGVIVDVKVFNRKKARPRTKEEQAAEQAKVDEIYKEYQVQMQSVHKERMKTLDRLLTGQKLEQALVDEETGASLFSKGAVVRAKDIAKLERADLEDLRVQDKERGDEIKRALRVLDDQMEELAYEQEREVEQLKRGDELPPGVLKKVVVYAASKRKVQVGDKVAGRHGNKGVIAKILPEEDMPFLPDGTPVDIVLNPLGVPSRMNVGQILETHLGWAAQALGLRMATPVFDGAEESQIKELMKQASLPEDGRVTLRDGLTGRPFDQKVAVGYIYMMKLIHLVDDKIHARSIGPYSLVTQQPLGGKAQFGGQRFGEMEVWALEAYGAAYILQELLTVKSDDVVGRTRIYESIVKGEHALKPGTPESFNVLVKELQSLCLDIRTEKNGSSNG
ncbi:MAG: DNA-directed RNA polymerase subunit beta [Candidatus Omnitrophica bacterium CG11_big_fil_rev_8_21_14_0_20_64_10]|nr:MAG: DNA-directed RNA polymerase subunit beta [Candidatus Omnitrophica bacterium CG11_big_fil_rev_8_21_14_0_20_64_10]